MPDSEESPPFDVMLTHVCGVGSQMSLTHVIHHSFWKKKKQKQANKQQNKTFLVYVKDKSYAMLPIVLILEDKWPICLQEKTSFSY